MDIKNLFAGVNPAANRNNQNDKNAVQQANEAVAEDTAKSAGQEKVTLTATAARFSQAQTMMNTQPEVNRERVTELRKAISEGSYKVDAGRLAGRMMSFESALRGR